jgi:hypothetical protein
VTGGTFLGGRLIKQHYLPVDCARQLVAGLTFHVSVHTLKRKGSALVIKQGRLPLGAVVAVDTGCNLPARELPAVNILVAILALGRSGLEIDV